MHFKGNHLQCMESPIYIKEELFECNEHAGLILNQIQR